MSSRLSMLPSCQTVSRRAIASVVAVLLSSFAAQPTVAAPADPLPAFPGAEGFGAIATGGRGGEVVHVTNLDDAGPGSFRDAVSQDNRTVVFDVGGIIRTKSQITGASNLTIAGQTAPGQGITLFGPGISFSGKTNVIMRYIRTRGALTNSRGSKQLNVSDEGSKMIFDHVSVSWGRWDNLGFTGKCTDITLQDSIIGEAIDPQRFGALIDSSDRITVVRNLWINNQNRNPKGKANMQYINNVIYNWGGGGYAGGHSGAIWRQDLINNYLIKGPSSSNKALDGFGNNDYVYASGNLVDMDRDGTLNGKAPTPAEYLPMAKKPAATKPGATAAPAEKPQAVATKPPADAPEPIEPAEGATDYGPPTFVKDLFNKPTIQVKILGAADAFEKVVATAGCSLVRDVHDQRMIDQTKSLGKEGAVIKEESTVGGIGELKGGTAPADTDQDGIPDAWEKEHKLDPKDAKDGLKVDAATGYTMLETYINSLAK